MTDLAEPLVAGLLAGWGVAIPLGAIGVMVVDIGMRAGLRPAAAAAAGVATADFLYAAVAARPAPPSRARSSRTRTRCGSAPRWCSRWSRRSACAPLRRRPGRRRRPRRPAAGSTCASSR